MGHVLRHGGGGGWLVHQLSSGAECGWNFGAVGGACRAIIVLSILSGTFAGACAAGAVRARARDQRRRVLVLVGLTIAALVVGTWCAKQSRWRTSGRRHARHLVLLRDESGRPGVMLRDQARSCPSNTQRCYALARGGYASKYRRASSSIGGGNGSGSSPADEERAEPQRGVDLGRAGDGMGGGHAANGDFLLARVAAGGELVDLTDEDIRLWMFWLGLDYILNR